MKKNYYVRLYSGDVFIVDDINNVNSINKNSIECYSDNIFDIVKVGDLIRIEYYSYRYNERVNRLFEVSSIIGDRLYISLDNIHMTFVVRDNNINNEETNPIITSIITKEKIDSIERNFDEENGIKLVL